MGGSNLNGLCPPRRGYRLPQFCLLNLNKKRSASNREQNKKKINESKNEKKTIQVQKRYGLRYSSKSMTISPSANGDGFSTMPVDFMSKLKQIVPNARMGSEQVIQKPEPVRAAPIMDPSIISSQQMPPMNMFPQIRTPINPMSPQRGIAPSIQLIVNQPRAPGPAMVPTQIMANLNSR
jgi:hypothetical protein